jgi:N-acetylmuramoyl-L-alanine amidase
MKKQKKLVSLATQRKRARIIAWLSTIALIIASPSTVLLASTGMSEDVNYEVMDAESTVPEVDISKPSLISIPYEREIEEEEPVVEPEIKEDVIVSSPPEIIEPEEETPEYYISDSDIDLIALIVMAEAEGESELGKRLVIDVILNRLDSPKSPNTVTEIIYQPDQWACVWNGRVDVCYVKDDIRQLVIEELENRTNYEVAFFRTKHYHTFGTPLFQEGHHYFSTY